MFSSRRQCGKLRARWFECINEKWQIYSWTIIDKKAIHFDLVISMPPQSSTSSFMKQPQKGTAISPGIDRIELTDICSFEKYVLKPKGYVFLLLQFHYFTEWFQAFRKACFQIIHHPYGITFDSNSTKNRNPKVFSQNAGLFCLFANLPWPSQYRNNKVKSPFHLVTCANSKSMAPFFNVQPTTFKLCQPKSTVPFYNGELCHESLGELTNLFCPQGGTVLDPYPEAMTEAIESLRTGWRCTAIDKHKDCFTSAFNILYQFLPSSKPSSTSTSHAGSTTHILERSRKCANYESDLQTYSGSQPVSYTSQPKCHIANILQMTENDEHIHDEHILERPILDLEPAQARCCTAQVQNLPENEHNELKTQEGVSCGVNDINAFISSITSDAEI